MTSRGINMGGGLEYGLMFWLLQDYFEVTERRA